MLCRRAFYDKRLAQEVNGDALGEVSSYATKFVAFATCTTLTFTDFFTRNCSKQEFNGYIFKIMGGQDKQGFPMKQGVLVPGRVQLLMKPGDSCFRGFGRRNGERRRKSVRGCIVSPDLSVLNLMIVKQGELQKLTCIFQPACESNIGSQQQICHCDGGKQHLYRQLFAVFSVAIQFSNSSRLRSQHASYLKILYSSCNRFLRV